MKADNSGSSYKSALALCEEIDEQWEFVEKY